MKIDKVTPIVLADRYVLVRVETDQGITGYGEASPMDAPLIVAALKHALAQVNQHTSIPITFGEEDFSLWRYRDGCLPVPHKPGLGVELNEETIRRCGVEA